MNRFLLADGSSLKPQVSETGQDVIHRRSKVNSWVRILFGGVGTTLLTIPAQSMAFFFLSKPRLQTGSTGQGLFASCRYPARAYISIRVVREVVAFCCCRCRCLAARADLAGGWTDTPPVTYEHGGSVLNVAIKLNGKVRNLLDQVCTWLSVIRMISHNLIS